MNGQISLMDMGSTSAEEMELRFLNRILPKILNSIEEHGGDPALLQIKPTKSDNSKSMTSGYSSVYFYHFTAFRIHLRGKKHYISVPSAFWDMIPSNFSTYQIKSEEKYKRLLVDDEYPLDSYIDFLVHISGEVVNRYPKEWSCCSRYMDCSDAKTCIHPDKAFALGCGYRRVLNSGRIFYGQNRNID